MALAAYADAGFSLEAITVKLSSRFEHAQCTPTQLEIKILKFRYYRWAVKKS